MKMKITIIATLAIIVAIAVVWIARERNRSAKYTCGIVIKQIQAAKETWAIENHKTKDAVPTWFDLTNGQKYLPEMPVCPYGGTYSIGKVGDMPRCTIPDNKGVTH